jgi:hypothetical protein
MNMSFFTTSHCRTMAAALMTTLFYFAPATAPAEITDEELIRFVQGYLHAAQQPTPDAEVDHYAKRVRYFDSGVVDHAFVAQDQRRYYKTWPERSFELLDGPVVIEDDGDAVALKFTIHYDVSGAGRRASGMTENTMRVRRFEDGLKIVGMSERKVTSKDLPRPQERPRTEIPETRTRPQVAPARRNPEPPSQPPPDAPPVREAPERRQPPREMPVIQERPTTPQEAPAGTRNAPLDDLGGMPAKPNASPQKATPVPETPGFVYPPGTEQTPKNMLDVRGYTSGQKVKDPRTGQIFIVP